MTSFCTSGEAILFTLIMPSAISEWSLSMATGGKPLYLPCSQTTASVYSQDGRYVIIALTHQLRVYFISTRQCIKTIDLDLHDLADLKIDVTNGNQVLLFKTSGEILTVNWKDKVSQPIISTIDINKTQSGTSLPLLSVISVKHLFFIIVTGRKEKKKGTPHTRYINYFDRNSESLVPIIEVANSINFATSLDNTKIAFITSDNDIVKETIPFVYRSPVTSIAVSNDSMIAIGTSAGPIQIVYGGLTTPKPQRVLKWHLDQVKGLMFTADNNYLLSGGMEKVLVFWQLETEKKQFLPRLNGVIDKISIDNYKNDYISLQLNVDPLDNNYEIWCYQQPKFAYNIATTLSKTKKKFIKSSSDFDKFKIRYDYTSQFEIHPKTKILGVGKVRSETKLLDPSVTLLKFTHDGEWMCTFDEFTNTEVDSLLLKNEKQYALKFWKYVGHKENATSGINNNNKTAMIPAPTSYFNGLAFLTADDKGGLRIWRPVYPKNNIKPLQQDAVALSWSDDNSLIFLAHECSILTIDSKSFEEIPDFKIPSLSGSRVRSLNMVNNNLIVLVAKVNTTIGAKNLIAIDPIKRLICLALNYYSEENNTLSIKSKILIFKPNQLKPICVQLHEQGVSSIRYFNSSFVFVDLDCRVGTIYSNEEITETIELGLTQEINNMLIAAQATADEGEMDIDNSMAYAAKVVDLHTFQPIFQNIEGVQVESLFERIVNVLK
ncbi:hypothetical protein FOB64_004681 [Candida albicans]|uniref:NET1-associated nuclear protein 1 n=1 Tax=Candida albicans TaxID=5476 RepID=A0A8H6F3K3_CANAX|nr:hypothetical protein FOB64_004681 [Candida albicans]